MAKKAAAKAAKASRAKSARASKARSRPARKAVAATPGRQRQAAKDEAGRADTIERGAFGPGSDGPVVQQPDLADLSGHHSRLDAVRKAIDDHLKDLKGMKLADATTAEKADRGMALVNLSEAITQLERGAGLLTSGLQGLRRK